MASSGTIGKINAGGNDYLVASTAFATCNTSANITAKVATIQDSADFTAIEGITVQVLFTYSNTADNPTLNINSTGAYPIYLNTGTVPGQFAASSWSNGSIVSFTLHNNFWYMDDVKEDIFIIHVSDSDGQVTVQESADELTDAVSRGAIPVIVWSDIDTTIAMIAQPQNLFIVQAFVAVNYANLISLDTMGANPTGSLGVYIVYWMGSQVPPTGISFQYSVENRNNKVSSISSASTSTEYPSAQAVYDYVTTNFAVISHTHGNITNDGDITTNVAIASGDRLVINDESSNQINNSSITFGTSTTQFLANDGTWQTPAGGSDWYKSSSDGLCRPFKPNNIDSVLGKGSITSGSPENIPVSNNTVADNVVATGRGSLTLYLPTQFTLSSTASAGATSYTMTTNRKLLDADVTFLKNLYFCSPNTPASASALQPTNITFSGTSFTATFASTLNPTASVSYLYLCICNASPASIAVGSGITTASGVTGTIAAGDGLVSTNFYELMVGQSQYITGAGNAAIGVRLKSTGNFSLLVGNNLLNAKTYAALIGNGHDSTNGPNGVAAFGSYSSISSDTAFAIGDGTDASTRSNAFEVHTDGRATLGADPTANMDAVTKQYADGLKGKSGSTDTSSKIYLTGATTQAADVTTFSDNQVYATNGQLDANKVRIAEHAILQYNSTDSAIEFVFA